MSPEVAEVEDHRAKRSENQALPLPAVCANTCRMRLVALDGISSPTYFIRVPCEPGAELIIETMLVTDKSIGKKPKRNQKASSAARFTTLLFTVPRQVVQISSRQLNPAILGMFAMRVLSVLIREIAKLRTIHRHCKSKPQMVGGRIPCTYAGLIAMCPSWPPPNVFESARYLQRVKNLEMKRTMHEREEYPLLYISTVKVFALLPKRDVSMSLKQIGRIVRCSSRANRILSLN
jgi:hypothetical protein